VNVEARQSALRDLSILSFLPADVRELVEGSFEEVSFPFGSSIVREGEPADALFILVNGRARVIKRGDGGEEVPLGVLRPGDSFGEMGLLDHATRTATVRATSEVEALRLQRAVFDALLEERPELRHYL